jgi:hypothetical protein
LLVEETNWAKASYGKLCAQNAPSFPQLLLLAANEKNRKAKNENPSSLEPLTFT